MKDSDAEGFIHRHQEVSGAQDAFLVAEGAVEGFAKRDADVFNGVVLIDIEIAFAGKLEVESTVTREEFEHVVEEANSGGDFVATPAVDGERERNFSFVGTAVQCGFSH